MVFGFNTCSNPKPNPLINKKPTKVKTINYYVDIKAGKRYIETMLPIIREHNINRKVPNSILLAIGILESDYGRFFWATEHNNHYGLRGSKPYKFKTIGQCVDFELALLETKYEPMIGENWYDVLYSRGYHTTKNYGDKLRIIVNTLNLTQYDTFKYI